MKEGIIVEIVVGGDIIFTKVLDSLDQISPFLKKLGEMLELELDNAGLA